MRKESGEHRSCPGEPQGDILTDGALRERHDHSRRFLTISYCGFQWQVASLNLQPGAAGRCCRRHAGW